jgi:hypothetical protein
VTYKKAIYKGFQNPFEVDEYLEPFRKNNFCDEYGEKIIEVGRGSLALDLFILPFLAI